MSRLLCFAAPVIPGKEGEWKKFTDELKGSRYADFKAARDKVGVRERTFVQHTPDGHIMVVVSLKGDNPEKLLEYIATAKDDFNKWFVESVKAVHGFDMSQPMEKSAMPEMIVDSGK